MGTRPGSATRPLRGHRRSRTGTLGGLRRAAAISRGADRMDEHRRPQQRAMAVEAAQQQLAPLWAATGSTGVSSTRRIRRGAAFAIRRYSIVVLRDVPQAELGLGYSDHECQTKRK